ncbi:suppressor of glycerol defect [Cladophialophora chaetospira]|uniref:Suppressor of glycerol defect n=1 Tax=Cladophialophora chaetospira TaxID=386627 RepID=A0AA39CKI2_9EURO|nr:suppressor of glycerol defect [Cladophialophora chaetospira]
MSRRNGGASKGIKLPFALQKELGIEGERLQGGGRRRQQGSGRGRKEQRRTDRLGRRQNLQGGQRHAAAEVAFSEEEYGEDDELSAPQGRQSKKAAHRDTDSSSTVSRTKSILKESNRPPQPPSPASSDSASPSMSRSSSPGLVLDASSRTFRDRAAEDEAEISALERKLSLKTKSSKSAVEDGLDDLLEGLDEHEARRVKRKADGKDWLERKRRKAIHDGDEELDSNEEDELDDIEDDDSEEYPDEDVNGGLSSDDDGSDADSFGGFDSEDEPHPPVRKKVRENPYVAPVAPGTSSGKYIPPSMRKAQNSEGASIERLKRQLQGHLNKLSEANLISILGEIEKVYQSNPRQDVTSVLIELLLSLFCDRSALQNTFVILHAAFATAVYKVIGVDFGAELLSQLVERFDQYHRDDTLSKEAVNLISLLANLFTFHLISNSIIFDHIRLLLGRLSENNTELLLRLIRDCGPQLRQDDPSSLKDIVQLMQRETARMNSAGEQMSVRTKFMIETMTDLKNNKMKAATNNAGLASEHITLMRKVLGSLNEKRSVRASEPLRITRYDIKSSDKKGKWWLVGASWKGNEPPAAPVDTAVILAPDQILDDESSIDLLALSRQYGMNTDVRRSIFIALLSAVDYQDGHMRILKLRLKRNQEQEIPKVLLRCAAGEKPYNHYYTLVAKKLCLDKKMRKAFQFALWSFFRRLGENPDLDEDGEDGAEEDVEMTEIANMARLYANLALDGAVPLGALKVLDLAAAKERTIMFVELMLAILFIEVKDKPSALTKALERAATEAPRVVKRLQFFIKKNVRSTDLVGKKDRKAVKQGCQMALGVLETLSSGQGEADI